VSVPSLEKELCLSLIQTLHQALVRTGEARKPFTVCQEDLDTNVCVLRQEERDGGTGLKGKVFKGGKTSQ
jgi:hypothetical protein